MKRKNKTRYVILGLLCESPLSGYEIKKIVDIRFTYFWSESYGQIYPELAKMESDGIIRKCVTKEETEEIGKIEEVGKSGRKNSCKYEITEQGKLELNEWLKGPVEKEMVRYELLLKLYFSNLIDPDIMVENIKEFQMAHRKQQHMFDEYQEFFENNLDMHDNHLEQLMVLKFGQKVWKAYDEWCDDVLNLLDKRKGKDGMDHEQNN